MELRLKEPKHRSPLRLQLGSLYFTYKRYWQWYVSGKRYAKTRWAGLIEQSPFAHVAFQHCSVLLRELRNVDLWLQQNKVHNLQLAIPRINRVVLRPGETLSYWRLIGSPSKRKGYREGMELYEGTFRPGVGGGLCQLSNLIYWMTLHTPLTVTERYRHQYDVFPDSNRTLPFGSGATCSYNYIDLQIRNETDTPFLLHLYLTDTHLVGEWRTERPLSEQYEVYEKNHRFRQEYWGGFTRHNQIWRKVLDADGSVLRDELLTENHALMMYRPLLPDGSSGSEERERFDCL